MSSISLTSSGVTVSFSFSVMLIISRFRSVSLFCKGIGRTEVMVNALNVLP